MSPAGARASAGVLSVPLTPFMESKMARSKDKSRVAPRSSGLMAGMKKAPGMSSARAGKRATQMGAGCK